MTKQKPRRSVPHLNTQAIRRIFPKSQADGPTVSKLSIIDATVARFTPTAAIWLYDKSSKTEHPNTSLFESLGTSLGETLNFFPHFTGQIQWATEDMVRGDAVPRHLGRPVVVHGTSNDPGVELIIAEYDMNLSDVVPSRDDRAEKLKEWNANNFRQSDFLPDTTIALSSLNTIEGLPSMAVQLTSFKCGGFAVSAMIAHPFADAVGLISFMSAWAARSRLELGQDTSHAVREIPKPLFDPTLLDRVAGLSPGSSPDPRMIAKARSLPMHRFDWWAEDAPGYPKGAKTASLATMPTQEELGHIQLTPSTCPPWTTWNMMAPVDHVQIRFSAQELARMKEAARAGLPKEMKTTIISRLDAALAHVWILINRARQHSETQDKVYLDMTLGLRNRVQPPLPESFVGSPLLLGYVEKTGEEAASSDLGPIAGAIRETMSLFTSDAVAAYIHDAAHEVSPQRLWQAFLGTRHTLVSSWVRAKTYELDFLGTQEVARYVQAIMPKADGLVHFMDVADTGDFDVSICVQHEVMERLLSDPLLRKYETEQGQDTREQLA